VGFPTIALRAGEAGTDEGCCKRASQLMAMLPRRARPDSHAAWDR
jgi:hypothetical protein